MNGSRCVHTLFASLLTLTLLLLGGSPAADAAGSRLLGTTTVTANDLLAKPLPPRGQALSTVSSTERDNHS
ncbi:hypothetical protein H1B31_01910 [Selenomonas timonae]|uniref:Secreted protein n=1 Tax=Selenomonas timonae TaxID=2754044 RepID=A0A7G7VKU8_9FIRM|nr:hypothetical protein [Selenomonas timonae]QNH54741.1 hypothetical protein H1B31_01910 [Selenomonas timonae]